MVEDFLWSLWRPIEQYGPKLPELLVTVVIGILAVKLIMIVLSRSMRLIKISRALANVLTSIIGVALWIMLFSELARQAGMTNLAITISGSMIVIGLALANGASTLTADIISGIYLAKDPDFEIGYRVRIGTIEGTIRKIDMRKVRVRDDDGKLHIFPNNVIDKAEWVVISREPKDIDDKTTVDVKKRTK